MNEANILNFITKEKSESIIIFESLNFRLRSESKLQFAFRRASLVEKHAQAWTLNREQNIAKLLM